MANFYLTDDMKNILNKVAMDVSKDSCCSQLSLNLHTVQDEFLKDLLSSILTFVANLSDIEYKELQNYLPYSLNVNEEDFDIDYESN